MEEKFTVKEIEHEGFTLIEILLLVEDADMNVLVEATKLAMEISEKYDKVKLIVDFSNAKIDRNMLPLTPKVSGPVLNAENIFKRGIVIGRKSEWFKTAAEWISIIFARPIDVFATLEDAEQSYLG